MRRGTSNATGFVIGLLLGLVLFLVAAPMFGNVFKKGGESIDALQSCDQGLIGSLAGEGGEAKCTGVSGDGASTMESDFPPPSGKKWQYVGKGWGCDEKKGAYCWLLIPGSSKGFSEEEIAKATCAAIEPGSLAVVKKKNGFEYCYAFDTEEAKINPDESFGLRYFTDDDTARCTYSGAAQGIGTSFSVNYPPQSPLCEQAVLYTSIAENVKDDKSIINPGGKLTVDLIVNVGGKAETKKFTVDILKPAKAYCSDSSASQCQGKTSGAIAGGYCVVEGSACTFSKTYECRTIIGETPVNNRVTGMPDTAHLEADEQICKGVEFGPGQTKCAYFADADGTWNEALFFCGRLENGECSQDYIAMDANGPFADDKYDENKDKYPECDS